MDIPHYTFTSPRSPPPTVYPLCSLPSKLLSASTRFWQPASEEISSCISQTAGQFFICCCSTQDFLFGMQNGVPERKEGWEFFQLFESLEGIRGGFWISAIPPPSLPVPCSASKTQVPTLSLGQSAWKPSPHKTRIMKHMLLLLLSIYVAVANYSELISPKIPLLTMKN